MSIRLNCWIVSPPRINRAGVELSQRTLYEPHELAYKVTGKLDHFLPYSSYSFGDPATPVARSYLGDPAKQRLIHGGAIRWRRQSDVDPSAFDFGPDKHPPLLPTATERIDLQSIGPSESYDVENECGSGGCQQSAGDSLSLSRRPPLHFRHVGHLARL
jgi:hypothetical protein